MSSQDFTSENWVLVTDIWSLDARKGRLRKQWASGKPTGKDISQSCTFSLYDIQQRQTQSTMLLNTGWASVALLTLFLFFLPNTDANTHSSGFYSANIFLELIAVSHWFVQRQMPLSPTPPAGKRIPSALTVSREIFSGQEPANG